MQNSGKRSRNPHSKYLALQQESSFVFQARKAISFSILMRENLFMRLFKTSDTGTAQGTQRRKFNSLEMKRLISKDQVDLLD